MSIAAIQWAFELELKDPLCKVVLLALADHYNDQSQCCWPSVARLCRFTGASERTIQRIINELVDLGHIEREDRPGYSSLFYLDVPKREPPSNRHPRPIDTPTPVTASPTPVQQTPHPRPIDTRTLIEPLRTSEGAPALAPDGARSAQTTREEWKRRLDGYDPHKIRATWKPFWGPRPDAVGEGHVAPADLLEACRKALTVKERMTAIAVANRQKLTTQP